MIGDPLSVIGEWSGSGLVAGPDFVYGRETRFVVSASALGRVAQAPPMFGEGRAMGESSEAPVVRLLADSMLGTLGKWLRLLGYDTAVATSYATDAELVRLARAEGRVILTRDGELARRRGVQALLVQAEDLEGQLTEVARALELPPPEPGTRCAECNSPLVAVGRGELADDVPPYVLQTQETFRRCPRCGRVYWRGTHWQGVERMLVVLEEAHGCR